MKFMKKIFGGSRLERLQKRAEEMEDSPEKVAVLQEIVEIVDQQDDLAEQLDARMKLVWAACTGGCSGVMIDAFRWSLDVIDKNPDLSPESVLWAYKWVISDLVLGYDTTEDELERLLDDFQRRLLEVEESIRPVRNLRWSLAMTMGRPDEGRKEFELWKTTAQGYFADCGACEIDSEVEYFIDQGDDEQALRTAQPILLGHMKCGEVPHITYANVIRPLLRLGRIDEARKYHLEGWPLVDGKRFSAEVIGEHLLFVTRVGDFERAPMILDGILRIAAVMNTHYAQMLLYDSAAIYLDRAIAAGHPPSKIDLPDRLPTFRGATADEANPPVDVGSMRDDPAALARWFREEADEAAGRFDQRNGNTHVSGLLKANAALVDG